MRLLAVIVLVALGCCGCSLGGDDSGGAPEPTSTAAADAVAAPPAAPPATAALTRIPEAAADSRLAYVALDQLAGTDLPVSQKQLLAAVLGRGSAVVGDLAAGADIVSAVQVGRDATVLRGPGAAGLKGVPSGDDGVIIGARPAIAEWLADSQPARNVIAPYAQRSVQSCLGDTLAQTILGTDAMGDDAAVGAGLANGANQPGLELRICGAPRLLREVDAMDRALGRRFKQADVAEQEVVERHVAGAIVPIDQLQDDELLDLLAGGEALRSLAGR